MLSAILSLVCLAAYTIAHIGQDYVLADYFLALAFLNILYAIYGKLSDILKEMR
jgi:VIT1/CCC1 family predicted Fe2+/Mn2+ transporter